MEQRVTSPAEATETSGSKILKSVCRSCHGGCGVDLHITDGQLTKVVGDPESPLNKGRLCPIGANTMDLVYHPDRLKYPLRRTGARGEGKWERISWDEALEEIARRVLSIKESHGAEAIAMGTEQGAIIFAGFPDSVMRLAPPTGANRALRSVSIRASIHQS